MHPDAGYNLHNSPHLKPAYVLDAALQQLSYNIAHDVHGLGRLGAIHCEGDIWRIVDYIRAAILPVCTMIHG